MYSKIYTGAISGIDSLIATVEVDVSTGMPTFEMVGLLNHEVREAKERVKVALKNTGIEIPPKRITVSISPADMRKEGAAYDLPVAVGMLVSLGHLLSERIQEFFAISIVICVALGLIYAQRAQRIYQRSASVMLRSDNKGQAQISELAAFADLGIGSTGIDVYNELQAFQSPLLMQDVVNQLRLNVTYKSKNWIGYVTDWYDKTPICVEYKNLPDHVGEQPLNSVTFVAEKEGQSQLTVKDFKINGIKSDAPAQTVKLGQPFKTPVGTVVLKATKEYGKNFEQAVIVGYERPELTAKSCQARLTAELADKLATVINFSYTDASEKRAEDVLNTLLDAYNEEWIRYTNKSTDNTAKFIDERLMSIERELGNVDSDIERFKSSNRLLDMNAETAQVTQESSKYSEQAFLANNQLAVARFIREYP